MLYKGPLKEDRFTFEAIMKHDDEDSTLELFCDKQLRIIALKTQEFFRITSY
jgi:hypothetical protein